MSSVNPLLWLCGNCGNKREVCCCDAPKTFDLQSMAKGAIGRSKYGDKYAAYKNAVSYPEVVVAALDAARAALGDGK